MSEPTDHVWQVYAEVGTTERHFNDLQSKYRALASTRLLGAFAATGFILSATLPHDLSQPLLIAAVGLAAAVGIALLWTLDLLVYHPLLDAAFVEGLRLERQHRWLPQVRHNMMRLHGNRGVQRRVRLFYLAGIGITAALGLVGLGAWLRADSGVLATVAVLVALLACVALVQRILHASAGTDATLHALDVAQAVLDELEGERTAAERSATGPPRTSARASS